MKRVGHLREKLISDDNLSFAIDEVNRSHHWHAHHSPNRCTAWVEEHKAECAEKLREILINGFVQAPPKVSKRWDPSAQKWREVSEPRQWPDQYIHHALIQVLQPVMMRGMDKYCCGSIRGRGTHYGKEALERWMQKDRKGTKYCFSGDIKQFYKSLTPRVVMRRMKRLIKDRFVLDLIWRIVKGGVLIGAYTSQWFANTVLQPLDQLIRKSGFARHYIRYMDNLTATGPNKRKLRKLRSLIEKWLNDNDLKLKEDWQVYLTASNIPGKNKRHQRGRLPSAVGYRYGRGYTVPRKHNLLRMKRQVARYRKRRDAGKPVSVKMASSLLSRFGQLKHCNNHNIYKTLLRGERLQRQLKNIIRAFARRKEFITWSMYLARRVRLRSLEPKAAPTPA